MSPSPTPTNSTLSLSLSSFSHFLKYALKRLQNWVYRLLNFISFGWIRLPAGSYLSDYYIPTAPHSLAAAISSGFNSSSGCLTSNSSESDDGGESNMSNMSSMSSMATSSASSASSNSSNSSAFRTRRRSPRTSVTELSSSVSSVAIEAVAHSYEDITAPDYHNYLWLSSRWDRTDLLGASYFVANWIGMLRSSSNNNSETTEKEVTPVCKPSTSTKHCKSFLNFYHKLASLPDSFFPRRRIVLPKRQKTLVLDLDETLIHSTAGSCVGFDFMIEVLIGRTSCLYYVYKRPHLDYFLEVVGSWFNLVIYTASLKEYADPVIDLLDDGRKLFKKRFSRPSCLSTNSPPYAYLKDLSLVDADLSKLALIDNSAASFALYPDNAIPIESWREGAGDQGLLDLLPFLDALRFVEDVRSVLSLRRLNLYANK